MNSVQDNGVRHATVWYIIIGIVLVLLLATYIYVTISSAGNGSQTYSTQSLRPVVLTPQEAAVRVAALDRLTSQQYAKKLTPSQAATNASSLSALEAR